MIENMVMGRADQGDDWRQKQSEDGEGCRIVIKNHKVGELGFSKGKWRVYLAVYVSR